MTDTIKLRSVEQVARDAFPKYQEISIYDIEEAITQDRQALLDAVCGVLDDLVASPYDEKNMFTEECSAYNKALTDAKTAIKNLLDSKN